MLKIIQRSSRKRLTIVIILNMIDLLSIFNLGCRVSVWCRATAKDMSRSTIVNVDIYNCSKLNNRLLLVKNDIPAALNTRGYQKATVLDSIVQQTEDPISDPSDRAVSL